MKKACAQTVCEYLKANSNTLEQNYARNPLYINKINLRGRINRIEKFAPSPMWPNLRQY